MIRLWKSIYTGSWLKPTTSVNAFILAVGMSIYFTLAVVKKIASVNGLTLAHLKKTPVKFMIFADFSHRRKPETPMEMFLGPPVLSFDVLVNDKLLVDGFPQNNEIIIIVSLLFLLSNLTNRTTQFIFLYLILQRQNFSPLIF
jgi:hypothetical protein